MRIQMEVFRAVGGRMGVRGMGARHLHGYTGAHVHTAACLAYQSTNKQAEQSCPQANSIKLPIHPT